MADWPTKRAWVKYAFEEFMAAGYSISSAYTLVKDPKKVNFSYRDNLWDGADLLATGIASFGHVSGVHYQNSPEWDTYPELARRESNTAWPSVRPDSSSTSCARNDPQAQERCTSTSRISVNDMESNIVERWRSVWRKYRQEGWLNWDDSKIELTMEGLLRADGLLPAFFEKRFSGGSLYMSDSLVFSMGQFEAEFPRDRMYVKNHMWAIPIGNQSYRFGFSAYAVAFCRIFTSSSSRSNHRPRNFAPARYRFDRKQKGGKRNLFADGGRLDKLNELLLGDPSVINVDKYGGRLALRDPWRSSRIALSGRLYDPFSVSMEVAQRTIKGQANA